MDSGRCDAGVLTSKRIVTALSVSARGDAHEHFATFGELALAVRFARMPEAERIVSTPPARPADPARQLHGFGVPRRPASRPCFDRVAQIEVDGLHGQLAGLDFGEVEDVVDDVEATGAVADGVDIVRCS
jgi:hypothetical protein